MTTNPFQSPEAYGAVPTKHTRESVDHMQAVNFVFENPNWVMNVLWTALALLSTSIIPVVGQLVIHGYQFAIIEALHLRPNQGYPDFDFDNLMDYLVTGVWVFLATLVVALITMPITFGLIALFFGLVVGGAAIGGEEAGGVTALITMPILVIFSIFVGVAINMLMVPFILRAGLTKDFGKTFDFGFAVEFVGNTWGQMLITGIVFLFIFLILEVLGLLMACVGVFFTIAIGMLMQGHLLMQLYEVHLARGGTPIPIKPMGSEKSKFA